MRAEAGAEPSFYRWQSVGGLHELTMRVRVQPGASRDVCLGQRQGQLRVSLTAQPVKGAANRTVCQFLASRLGVRSGQLEVVKGHHQRNKVLVVLLETQLKTQVETRLRKLSESGQN